MSSQPHIPTYIPFDQAARHYGLSQKVLTQAIQAGKIEAVQLPSGDLLVAAENNGKDYQTKEEIIARKFAHLKGQTRAHKRLGGGVFLSSSRAAVNNFRGYDLRLGRLVGSNC